MNNHEMVDAMLLGKMRALHLASEDMISADSNAINVAAALVKLERFVVQDIFFLSLLDNSEERRFGGFGGRTGVVAESA
jgi:predicted molibdopterin-dependent oxidoreductase YjgC